MGLSYKIKSAKLVRKWEHDIALLCKTHGF